MQKWMFVLWPSFIVAGVAEGIFFSLVNPQELYFLGHPVHYSPVSTYSIGFLAFWGICAVSSALTWCLMRPADEVNRRRPTAASSV